jgi:hypothetical protein
MNTQAIEDEIKKEEEAIRRLKKDVEKKENLLAGLKKALTLISQNTTKISNEYEERKRRNRLGAKKRLIYAMIAQRPVNFELHYNILNNLSDPVTDRNVRDIIRWGIEDKDIEMFEDSYALTHLGLKILQDAPLPSREKWQAYQEFLDRFKEDQEPQTTDIPYKGDIQWD